MAGNMRENINMFKGGPHMGELEPWSVCFVERCGGV